MKALKDVSSTGTSSSGPTARYLFRAGLIHDSGGPFREEVAKTSFCRSLGKQEGWPTNFKLQAVIQVSNVFWSPSYISGWLTFVK